MWARTEWQNMRERRLRGIDSSLCRRVPAMRGDATHRGADTVAVQRLRWRELGFFRSVR